MKCKVTHEIKTERGFRVFEAGQDYDPVEIGDRGKYFESEPPAALAAAEIEKPSKRRKINEEVADNDAG